MEIKGFAQNLAEYMAKLSVKYYSDEWMVQLEFELWRDLIEEPELLNADEITKLNELKDLSEGWVIMNYETGKLEFLTLPTWLEYNKTNRPF